MPRVLHRGAAAAAVRDRFCGEPFIEDSSSSCVTLAQLKSGAKIHHEHTPFFGIAAEYAHPIETFLLGIDVARLFFAKHMVTRWA